jgi:hypothetical protein
MENTVKSKWWVDVILFVGFIMAFFLDLTGLELHQWIGVAAGVLAAYHLITHWSWVRKVTQQFLGKTSGQARLYYLIDLLIFAGFLLIGFTGLIISSWLNLALTSYGLWLWVHILASIATLVLTVIKIGLHGRWVVATAKKIFSVPEIRTRGGSPAPVPNVTAVPATARQQTSRNEFLKMMGVVGAASFIAFLSAASGMQETSAASDSEVETASSDTTQVSSGQESTSLSGTCVVQCNRGCSYPGNCRRYTDSNSNGRCDFGECA